MDHRIGNIATGAAGLFALALVAGCGGARQTSERPGAVATERTPPPSRLAAVFVLESGGAAPEDTTVTFAARQGRVIIVRRSPPDNSLFARVTVPADSTKGADSVRLTIRPTPGRYGIDLEVRGGLPRGAQLAMSYAVHFVAPAGAKARYESDLGFEKALFLAQVTGDSTITYLPTLRPGSDLISAAIPGPGRFVVAAPRN